jgi:hypothetical protein
MTATTYISAPKVTTTLLSKLPKDTINVTHCLINPIDNDIEHTSDIDSDSKASATKGGVGPSGDQGVALQPFAEGAEYIRGFDIPLNIQYSKSTNHFYIKKGDKYKLLRWRDQKQNDYSYKYVLIPYKKNKPIKILQKSWEKMAGEMGDLQQ